jgi:hypothetical protein
VVTLSSSHPSSITIASSLALRLRCLAGRIHKLGERPLFELMCELSGSSATVARFESYAALDARFIAAHGGRDLPNIRVIK